MTEPAPEFTPDDPEYPSGPWAWFYNYEARGARHRQEMGLAFRAGRMTGSGHNDVGSFFIRGG